MPRCGAWARGAFLSATLNTDLRLQQSQILAPQLQQSLKLLQLPSLELQTLLSQQLATNPTLEQYDPVHDDTDIEDTRSFDPDVQDREDAREEQAKSISEENADHAQAGPGADEVFERELDQLTHDDESWDSYYDTGNAYRDYRAQGETVSYHERREDDDEQYSHRIQSIAADYTLVDELREQFGTARLTPAEDEVVEYLLGSLDHNGFLHETPEEIAQATNKEVAVAATLIAMLKTFDPPGIGAKDLQECLLIQLERQNKKDSLPWRILKEHYHDLVGRKFDHIIAALGITADEFQQALRSMGSLDPKPGRDLSTATAPHIRADVSVTRGEDGSFRVETNDNLLPYVRVSPRIKALLKSKSVDKPQAQYLRQQIREGETLINNLQFRKRTVLAVAEAIVEAQKEFMEDGPMSLKPMSMKEIAAKVGVHEATVSRTVNHKYMDTPQGLFEMRFFFSSHVTDDQGKEVSTNAVKAKLKELIEAEDRAHPLSDDALAGLLRKEGFPVARRTVVKYRQMLGIPNARQRRPLL